MTGSRTEGRHLRIASERVFSYSVVTTSFQLLPFFRFCFPLLLVFCHSNSTHIRISIMSMEEDQPWEVINNPKAKDMPPQEQRQHGPLGTHYRTRQTKWPSTLSRTSIKEYSQRARSIIINPLAKSRSLEKTTSLSESTRLSATQTLLRKPFNSVPPLTNTYDLQPRPEQSRNDVGIALRRSSTSPCAETNIELKLRQENAELRQALVDERIRVEVERERVKHAGKSKEEMREMARSIAYAGPDSKAVEEMNTVLEYQNRKLRSDLDDAISHIFSLQPYRRELTSKEVERVMCLILGPHGNRS